MAVTLGQGFRPYLLSALKDITGNPAYPGYKLDPHGFLNLLQSQTKPNVLKLNTAGGHKNTVQVKYKQRLTKDFTDTTKSCDNTVVIPTAEVGFLGVVRNEETLQPAIYADRMPERLDDRIVFVLDPMLATGGSLISAIEIMLARGAKKVIAITLISAPEGVEAVGKKFANQNVTVVTSALDEKLNEHGYIVPGLGDAGDRLFGAC